MTITKVGSHAITQELRDLIDAGEVGGAGSLRIYDDGVFKVTGSSVSFDTNLSVVVTGSVAFISSSANSSTGSLAWFNVKDYGAVDGAESTVAFANAISALTSAGRGVLYVPAGTYTVSGSFIISVPFLMMGDGSLSHDSTQYVSRVVCSRGTVTLFATTAKIGQYKDLTLVCGTGTVPTAGAGISITGSYSEPRIDFDNVSVHGFYDDIDIMVGKQWVMDKCYIAAPVRYGLRIRNVLVPDAGDWNISNTGFYSERYDSDAGIRIESSGGGKIVNTKINVALDNKRFNYGIDLSVAGSVDTSNLQLSNVSIENYRTHGIRGLTSAGASSWDFIKLNNIQFGQYNNISGSAIHFSPNALGDMYGLIFDNLTFRCPSGVAPAIIFTNITGAYIGAYQNFGYSSVISQTNCLGITVQDMSASGSGGSSTGTVSTDTIWDAKGDLAIGSGSNAASILPVGTDGHVLTADSTQSLGVKWSSVTGSSVGSSDIGARVYRSSGTVIANNSATYVPIFDSERWDTDSIHSGTSGRLTCNTAGKYYIGASVEWAAGATGARIIWIRLNGTTEIVNDQRSAASSGNTRQNISTIYNLEVGNYLELGVYQTNGGNLELDYNPNFSPEFMIQRIA